VVEMGFGGEDVSDVANVHAQRAQMRLHITHPLGQGAVDQDQPGMRADDRHAERAEADERRVAEDARGLGGGEEAFGIFGLDGAQQGIVGGDGGRGGN
jgi:hypothetical protein